MRTLPLTLALVLSLAVAAGAGAAPRKKTQDESPPTAQPDSTLVAPDTTPPPPTTAVPTNPVEMQPIGPTAGSTASALLAVTNGGAAPAPAPTPAPGPGVTRPVAPPPAVAPAPAPPEPPPAPPPEPPVVARAEQCLRTEAPRAARAESSVKLAVELLLEDLCGAEVDRAALFAHNLDVLARFTPQSERSAAGLSGARVDPESGEIVNPPAGDVTGALAAAGYTRDAAPPPQLRRFAAELVLALRTAPPPAVAPPAKPVAASRKRH